MPDDKVLICSQCGKVVDKLITAEHPFVAEGITDRSKDPEKDLCVDYCEDCFQNLLDEV